MKCRFTFLPIAAALAVLTFGPGPAGAAMPVTGTAQAGSGDLVLVAKKQKSARQKEIDRSVDTGTVPARYRSRVPKRYHQYIPFAK